METVAVVEMAGETAAVRVMAIAVAKVTETAEVMEAETVAVMGDMPEEVERKAARSGRRSRRDHSPERRAMHSDSERGHFCP